jgi:hypothetical protein
LGGCPEKEQQLGRETVQTVQDKYITPEELAGLA